MTTYTHQNRSVLIFYLGTYYFIRKLCNCLEPRRAMMVIKQTFAFSLGRVIENRQFTFCSRIWHNFPQQEAGVVYMLLV